MISICNEGVPCDGIIQFMYVVRLQAGKRVKMGMLGKSDSSQ